MTILNFYPTIRQYITFVASLYGRFEDYLTHGEQDADIRVKKKVMIYHFSILLVYFTILPLISPYATLKLVLFHYCLWGCNFVIIKTRSYNFIMSFFVISYMLGIYVIALRPENSLKIIGLALVQHNHSFMIYKNRIFKPVTIIISLVIVFYAQNHLAVMIEDNDIVKILDTIKRLQYGWGPLYLFNQFCAMHFAENYAKALEETKETYKNLEKTNQELNEMNNKLKVTLSLLEEKNKELNAAIKTRELFIAGVSHEFRNPLNSMMGNIELLSLEIKDAKWKEMLNTCKVCGDVLLGLMNNILDVAKINAEKLELSILPVNFYRLIEKVWSVSAIKIREKGLKGHLSLSGNLPQFLELDSHRLTQILLNVIGNATKFTNSGFVKVIISWHNQLQFDDLKQPNSEFSSYTRQIGNTSLNPNEGEEISPGLNNNSWAECSSSFFDNPGLKEIKGPRTSDLSRQLSQRIFSAKTLSDVRQYMNQTTLTEYDNRVEAKVHTVKAENLKKEAGILKIEVLDTGCGITPAALGKIFQPFTQADSSVTRRFGGTGLGLYISKQLVKKMEGDIGVYSEEQCGTNFCVLIPTITATAQDLVSEEDDIIMKSGVKRALVVDDLPLNQTLMMHYLKKMDVQVEIVSNGEEAVQRYKERGYGYYSFITMDIQMPVMDGMTASKKIREYEMLNRFEKSIPIIMVTGNCTEMEKDSCLNPQGEIRASYFFRKPFVFEECKSCVKNILNNRIGF